MTHEFKHCDSVPTRYEKRMADRTSGVALPCDEPFSVGFCSLDPPDPDEAFFRAALEGAGDFALRRLESPAGAQGPMPSASDVTSLRLSAVIVVLGTAEITVVKPLFARLRLGDPRRPILVAPRGLTADGISEVLAHGASDFLLPPYRAEDLVPRLRRMLHPARRRDQLVARIQAGVGLQNIVGRAPVCSWR